MPALGQVVEEPNGNLKVTRNGQSLVIRPSSDKDVGIDELMALRHFLTQSETLDPSAASAGSHVLVVIDHAETRIYNILRRGVAPQQVNPELLSTKEYFRHAHNSKGFTRGQEKPDPNTYFEPVANKLANAEHILLFGTGTGMASEMEQFVKWVNVRHSNLAKRIIGTVSVDEHHLTEGQMLEKARDFYAKAGWPV